MAVRNTYTLRDERLMWEYIFERLQDGDVAAYQPKGLKLWKNFEATQKTNKTASSLATHFRKAMYDHIEEAKIPVEQQLYIISQLNLKLSRRQQKTIEYKENISITLDDLGFVTGYEKKEDDSVSDEEGYGAFELNGSVPKVAEISRNPEKSSSLVTRSVSGRYNLRKRLNENNKSFKIYNSEAVATMALVENNNNRSVNRNENRNVDSQSVGSNQNEKLREIIESEPVSHYVEFMNNRKSSVVSKDPFDMKTKWSKVSRTVAQSNMLALMKSIAKKEQGLLAIENVIDEELKQLLAYIINKQQLRGVEKMRVEKILELRAEEAKRLGIGLRSYLKKIQQRVT